jgi:tungstate transport system substrate-binding protein
MRRNNAIALVLVVAFMAAAAGCACANAEEKIPGQNDGVVMVSTTTSLFDTGLLDYIEDDFESKYPLDLRFIAVGTGIAIQQAERGDVDCSLVHAPSLELGFLQNGNGVNRNIIAYNYFAIVGPKSDLAKTKGKAPLDALKNIVNSRATFISRDDKSGTNTKELELWKALGYTRDTLLNQSWYKTTGQGMGATLIMADELGGYTLTDMGTYLKYAKEGSINLAVQLEGGKELMNVYSAIAVNPAKHPNVNFEGSMEFIDYLCSKDTQELIGRYGKSEYGRNLFYPARGLLTSKSGQEYGWMKELAFFEGSECPEKYRLAY